MVEERPVCPKCGASNPYKKGFTARGKQRYQCKKCGYSFTAPENHVRLGSGHVCIRCGSQNVIWSGYTLLTGGRRRHRLKCKDCGRSFYPPEDVEPKGDSRENPTDQNVDGESPGNSLSPVKEEVEG